MERDDALNMIKHCGSAYAMAVFAHNSYIARERKGVASRLEMRLTAEFQGLEAIVIQSALFDYMERVAVEVESYDQWFRFAKNENVGGSNPGTQEDLQKLGIGVQLAEMKDLLK